MGLVILLTGQPGVGKTTVIRAVADRLGERAGGFYTEEVRDEEQRDEGRRTGFRLIALSAGPVRTGTLASVNIQSRYRVGRYSVCIRDLERVGVSALRNALEEPGVDVIIVDEIGKMELFSAAFRDALQLALAGPKPVVASIMSGPQPWLDAVKARSDVTLVEVTRSNRQGIPDQVFTWLGSALTGRVPA